MGNRRLIAWFYTIAGKPSATIPLVKRALKSEPLNKFVSIIWGPIACFEGRVEEAVEYCSAWYNYMPDNTMSAFWYILTLANNKKTKKVISLVEKSYNNPSKDVMFQFTQILKFAIKGELDEIKLLLSNEFMAITKRDGQISCHIASFNAFLNQPIPAMEWMENAVDRGFINYPFMNKIDPLLENIRGEARFKKLMKKVKDKWENFEK